jgi:predicted 3-demethylubiquinone-9 3-methyltransferase (glyoxalase superfamily)
MQKTTPFLWFDNRAEEAMNFYLSVFKNSKQGTVRRYGPGAPSPEGSVMSATFEINGQEMTAFNGGPMFTFSSAISFFVPCETQEEIDDLWDKLSEGGEKIQCGWLKDKFGITWQVVPTVLGELLQNKDREKTKRVMQAMMKMTKLDIKALQEA